MLIYDLLEVATTTGEMYNILIKRIIKIREDIGITENHPLEPELYYCEKQIKVLAEAKKEILERRIKKLINMEIDLGITKDKTFLNLRRMEHSNREAKQHQLKKLWFWLTINPDWNKITIEDFKKKIVKLVKKKSIADFYIVLEQRSSIGIDKYKRDRRNRKKHNEEMLNSIHAHILLKRDVNYKGRDFSKFAGDCKNTFKDCFTSIYRQKIKINSFSEPVFYYYWLSPDMLENKMNYIKGEKQIEDKNIKQELDTVMRKMIEVPDCITMENISLL